MARGNLFLGTARGSLGDITMYRFDGQQVSRVRVRKIKNPQTEAQMVPRIVLATVSKAYSMMQPIVSQSFQGYEGQEKNMRRFMKMNVLQLRNFNEIFYWKFKDGLIPRDTSGNFNAKDTFDMAINGYYVSEGDLPAVPYDHVDNLSGVEINAPYTDSMTYQQICNYLNVDAGTQLTIVQLVGNPETLYVERFMYSRVILSPANGDMTTKFINSGKVNLPNPKNEGEFEANLIGASDNRAWYFQVPFTQEYEGQCILGAAAIVSRYESGKWRRSTARIRMTEDVPTPGVNVSPLSMTNALESFMKDIKSDKYLNQANTNEAQVTRSMAVEELEEEIQTTSKRVRKPKNDE